MDDIDLQDEEIRSLQWKAANEQDEDALLRLAEITLLSHDIQDYSPYYGILQYNETVENDNRRSFLWTHYLLSETPLVVNSLTGTIYLEGSAVQNFVPKFEKDVYALSEHYHGTKPEVRAEEVRLDRRTGLLSIRWNKPPTKTKVRVSYEYIENPMDRHFFPEDWLEE